MTHHLLFSGKVRSLWNRAGYLDERIVPLQEWAGNRVNFSEKGCLLVVSSNFCRRDVCLRWNYVLHDGDRVEEYYSHFMASVPLVKGNERGLIVLPRGLKFDFPTGFEENLRERIDEIASYLTARRFKVSAYSLCDGDFYQIRFSKVDVSSMPNEIILPSLREGVGSLDSYLRL